MDTWIHPFLPTTLQRKCRLLLIGKKTKAWGGKATEPRVTSHLWMMDLSYSSPAGVSMMANSSRVTWHSAGFCTEAVMVLMSCGRTRSGEAEVLILKLCGYPNALFSTLRDFSFLSHGVYR